MKKHIVHKAYWNYEKEEKWLNEMASKGYNLVDYTFMRYLFEKGTPGEYIYRIELLPELTSHPESKAYIEFMESVGVEYVGKWFRWVFFRKKASEGAFEIFSDYDSKIRHYRRICVLFGIVGVMNLFAFIANIISGNILVTGMNGFYLSNFSPLFIINGIFAGGFIWLIINYIIKILRLRKDKLLHG